MWWSPEDPETATTAVVVSRLLGRYREYLSGIVVNGGEPLFRGIGSAFTLTGWQPLVLLGYEVLERESVTPPNGRFQLSAAELVPGLGALLEPMFAWDVPPNTVLEVIHTPVPARWIGPGAEAREVGAPTRVTKVGLPCSTLTGTPAVITAGHLITQPSNSSVEVLAEDASGLHLWIPGHVTAHNDPINAGAAGGYDYAVIELDDPRQASILSIKHNGSMTAPTPPYLTMNIRTYGGLYGSVNGALAQWGDAQRQWLSCWSVGPSHLLHQGDSGTLVLGQSPGGHTDSAFGHFVGGSGWPGSPHFNHLFVQDLGQAMASGPNQSIVI